MIRLIFILIFCFSLSSCFTSKLLEEDTNVSSVAPKNYSFNRAYYSSDSILHLDFNNLNSKEVKTSFYSVSININTILNEYNRIKGKNTTNFKGRFLRKYGILNGYNLVLDSLCNLNKHYDEATLLNFDEIKANYSTKLEFVGDSSFIIDADIVADNCIMKPPLSNCNFCSTEETINSPWYVYIIPTLKCPQKFVGLRIPLRNMQSKLKLLPVAIVLDIITSPIQLGINIFNHKSDKESRDKKTGRVDSTKPPPNRNR